MIAPDGYTRSTFYLRNDTGRPLTADDLDMLLGSEMSASLHDVVLSSGTVTNVVVDDDSARMRVTVESGGRGCMACGTVFAENRVGRELILLGELRKTPALLAGRPVYEELPNWVWVCFEPATCQRRRFDDEPPNDGEGAGPARFEPGPQGVCVHCSLPIEHDGTFWRHTGTMFIPCVGNATVAAPKADGS